MKTTAALKAFLKSVSPNPDLTDLYTPEMEVQIMVRPNTGEPVHENGVKLRNVWETTNEFGSYTFKHIRIPHQAMSDPFFNDTELRFPLGKHCECVGMTGWNWTQRKSYWVAFDFDAISGHAPGIGVSQDSLNAVKDQAKQIPWVQVRSSTGGVGLHLYVYFDPQNLPTTQNHTEHSALARAVLGQMERATGFDFRGNLDVLGGNMWVWHERIAETGGLACLKDRTEFCPDLGDWKAHLDVVQGKSGQIRFKGIADKDVESFNRENLVHPNIELDDIHRDVEARIRALGYTILWIPDYHCWQTHTHAFKELQQQFPKDYIGVYDTFSQGKDKGSPNCFVYPMQNGRFRITRFTRGAAEHSLWTKDDWTWIIFNQRPELATIAALNNGIQMPGGKGFYFATGADAIATLDTLIGPEHTKSLNIPEICAVRMVSERGALNLELELGSAKMATPTGYARKGNKAVRVVNGIEDPTAEKSPNDWVVRALVNEAHEFLSWVTWSSFNSWIQMNKDNVRSVLTSQLQSKPLVEDCLGTCLTKPWEQVSIPFQPEYPGGRRWNRHATQLRVTPSGGGDHHHWDAILSHLGQDLNEAVNDCCWCKAHGVHTGMDYIVYWIAFMLRQPYGKLPYLFFYGPQNSGKSIFHEALALLIKGGIVIADEALKGRSGFNGELAGAILCIVEETDLSNTRLGAYDRMKAWVTGDQILINAKFTAPYHQANITHWVQTANDREYCPVIPGDTRVVMSYVAPLEKEIPKNELLDHLRSEAPNFLKTLFDLKLPKAPGRLNLPTICSDSKQMIEDSISDPVHKFIDARCHHVPGALLSGQEFFEAFGGKSDWKYTKVLDTIRERGLFPIGRAGKSNACHIGNLSLTPGKPDGVYIRPPNSNRLVKQYQQGN